MSGDPLNGESQAFIERDAGFPSDHFFCFLIRGPQLHYFTFIRSNTLPVTDHFRRLTDNREYLVYQIANANGIVIAQVDFLTQYIFSCRNTYEAIRGISDKSE